jgi:hypothetical protein
LFLPAFALGEGLVIATSPFISSELLILGGFPAIFGEFYCEIDVTKYCPLISVVAKVGFGR